MTAYYILRDKLPFLLTLVYHNRDRFEDWTLEAMGLYLINCVRLTLGYTLLLLLDGKTLESLVDMPWSYPSPIQWSLLILLVYQVLRSKGYDGFSSFYLASMTALGGGWLWELFYGVPYWIESGFGPWNFLNFRPLERILFFDFHIFALPIVFRELRVKLDTKFLGLIIADLISMMCLYESALFFHKLGSLGGNTYYSWIIRGPTIIFLYLIMRSVENEYEG